MRWSGGRGAVGKDSYLPAQPEKSPKARANKRPAGETRSLELRLLSPSRSHVAFPEWLPTHTLQSLVLTRPRSSSRTSESKPPTSENHRDEKQLRQASTSTARPHVTLLAAGPVGIVAKCVWEGHGGKGGRRGQGTSPPLPGFGPRPLSV